MEYSDRSSERQTDIAPLITPSSKEKVSLFRQVNINLFWLANNFQWNAIIAVIVPSMVAKFLDPAYKDLNLPLVVVWGTLAAVIINPLAGAISDYLPWRLGRRRPFLLLGTACNILALLAFGLTPFYAQGWLLLAWAIIFFLLEVTNNIANAPWSAIIADQIPQSQRGMTAGINGLCLLLGTGLGSLIAGMVVNKLAPIEIYQQQILWIFVLIAAVQLVFVLYTVLTVHEEPLSVRDTRIPWRHILRNFAFKPSQYPDLAWVLLGRLLVLMGIWGIFYFLQYYADDVLGQSGEQFIGGIFLPLLLLASLPTSLVTGWLSDHWGRKGLVYLSGFMMTLVCLIFIFFQNTTGSLIAAIFFGIGYGAYTSVDWALVTDVLPSEEEAGKFLGMWSAMGILPQVIGISIGGIVLQLLHNLPNHFGYTVLFLVTIIYFLLGTLAIYRVKKAR